MKATITPKIKRTVNIEMSESETKLLCDTFRHVEFSYLEKFAPPYSDIRTVFQNLYQALEVVKE